MTNTFSDQQLMAFADGALGEPEFTNIANAIEADAELAHRLELLALGGHLAEAVYAPLADLPLPAPLRQGIDTAIAARTDPKPGATVLPLGRRPAVSTWMPWAIAAALGILVFGPIGYWAGSTTTPPRGIQVGESLAGDLLVSLVTLPAGEQTELASGDTLRPIGTFTNAAGQLCREFELDGTLSTVAITCRAGDEWKVAIALDAPVGNDGFAPASSLEAIDAFLGSIEASPNLSPEDERAALSPR